MHLPVLDRFAERTLDRGLEFAAGAIRDVLAILCITVTRLPGYTPPLTGQSLHDLAEVLPNVSGKLGWMARSLQPAVSP